MAARKRRTKTGSRPRRSSRSTRGAKKKTSRRKPAKKKRKVVLKKTSPRRKKTVRRSVRSMKDNVIDINISPMMVGIAVVAIVMFAYYFFVLSGPGADETNLPPLPPLPEIGGDEDSGRRVNCGNLDVEVQESMEAVNYFKSGVSRPANPESKYIVMTISVKNMLFEERDYSGYRMELTGVGEESYISTSFSMIESLTLYGEDGTEMEYECEELPLASLSRVVMEGREEVTGCKMFHVVEDFDPASIKISDVDGEICTVEI